MFLLIKTPKNLLSVKPISYISITCLFVIILILKFEPKIKSFPSTQFVKSLTLHPNNSSFRNELINKRLTSYSSIYDNSFRECNTNKTLNDKDKEHFSAASKLLSSLRQKIVPYPDKYFYGRGIVLSVGPGQLKFAEVNLQMIQFSGTRLPVQIWYSSNQVSKGTMIQLLNGVPKVNGSICCFDTHECDTRHRTWKLNAAYVYMANLGHLHKRFPYKPAAIISATFAEVLFLDADAYVTRDPEELFLFDPMYLKFGALFHPDAHISRQHPLMWKLLNLSCAAEEYELDSATILVDKRRVWNGLYMAKLMNDNHEVFYNIISEGDKDTFRLSFRYMNVKYYIVVIPCASGGFDGTRFCGRTLCKTDSLGQHVYVNHIHVIKYEDNSYHTSNIEYTRIILGDSNNSSYYFLHCRVPGASTSCFQAMKLPNPQIIDDKCYTGEIPPEEIEDQKYMLDQPLLFEKSRDNKAFISKTNNLMPNFTDNVLKYLS